MAFTPVNPSSKQRESLLDAVSDDQSADSQLYEHRCCVDYGTTNLKLGYQLVRKGHPPGPMNNAMMVPLQRDNTSSTPQRMGFYPTTDRGYQFLWGHEFEAHIEDWDAQTWTPHQAYVFKNLKVCLYPSPQQEEQTTRVENKLKRFVEASDQAVDLGPVRLQDEPASADQLGRFHLSGILHAFNTWLEQKRWRRVWSAEQIAAMPQRWIFTIPETADIASNRRFQEMISLAGFPKGVMLVSEIEAAASYLLADAVGKRQGLPLDLDEGDEVLICDGGGMTVNVGCCRMRHLALLSSGVYLDSIHRAGSACGSNELNRKCLQFVRDESARRWPNSGFSGLCDRAGLTEDEAEAKLSDEIDRCKHGFGKADVTLAFRGIDQRKGNAFAEPFHVDRVVSRKWMQETLNEVMVLVDHATQDTSCLKMVLLTGGLFRSGWLVDGLTERLRYRYPHIDVNHYGEESPDGQTPVARGGLMRSEPGPADTSTCFSLGVLRAEPFDSDIHPHDLKSTGKTFKAGGTTYVKKCWSTILPYGDGNAHSKRQKWNGVWVTYEVKPEQSLLEEIVWCADRRIPDHTCVYVPQPREEMPFVEEGIQEWKYASLMIDPEKLKKYPSEITPDGRVHIVVARVYVKVSAGKKELLIETVRPDFDPTKGISDKRPPKTSNYLRLPKQVLETSDYASEVYRNRVASAAHRTGSSTTSSRPTPTPVAQLPTRPAAFSATASRPVPRQTTFPAASSRPTPGPATQHSAFAAASSQATPGPANLRSAFSGHRAAFTSRPSSMARSFQSYVEDEDTSIEAQRAQKRRADPGPAREYSTPAAAGPSSINVTQTRSARAVSSKWSKEQARRTESFGRFVREQGLGYSPSEDESKGSEYGGLP